MLKDLGVRAADPPPSHPLPTSTPPEPPRVKPPPPSSTDVSLPDTGPPVRRASWSTGPYDSTQGGVLSHPPHTRRNRHLNVNVPPYDLPPSTRHEGGGDTVAPPSRSKRRSEDVPPDDDSIRPDDPPPTHHRTPALPLLVPMRAGPVLGRRVCDDIDDDIYENDIGGEEEDGEEDGGEYGDEDSDDGARVRRVSRPPPTSPMRKGGAGALSFEHSPTYGGGGEGRGKRRAPSTPVVGGGGGKGKGQPNSPVSGGRVGEGGSGVGEWETREGGAGGGEGGEELACGRCTFLNSATARLCEML